MTKEGNLLVLFQDIETTTINIVAYYKLINAETLALLQSILDIKLDSATAFSSNEENMYAYIISDTVLRLYFIDADIKSRGIPVFERFKKKCKNGKVRTIYAPNPEIKSQLRELNTLFQKVYDQKNIDFQVAYKKGKNVKDNAKIHLDHEYIYNIDLKDFYPSCKRELVEKYVKFLFNGCVNREILLSRFLDINLENDGLFIGNPFSGCIANTIISAPVNYLHNICNKDNMGFSVYADDMTFSSDKFITKKFVKDRFNLAFVKYNLSDYFKLNEGKSIGYSKGRRKITGVAINHNGEITTKRSMYKKIRVGIHHLSVGKTDVNTTILRGRLNYAFMIDDSGKYAAYVMKFLPTIRKYKLLSTEKIDEIIASKANEESMGN